MCEVPNTHIHFSSLFSDRLCDVKQEDDLRIASGTDGVNRVKMILFMTLSSR